ncbi:hypothetical protein IWC96_11630 [Brevundimonas sp. BAL450]|jgi:hypothetical protein|uniref:DUF6468 domain-containing protein n=1 Tax=Brevundimonas abyssalis TAR-001 TaxID=1391729 RepID=A0A8E0KMX6_9CAUL|nr:MULTISPECIES: DUF6468 domain-containing protein [Brevundimonas]MBG7615924.1 hypothetical protein [Brevundimonas sp. BAL450]GAD58792.1 hypothetical protein MBEBAB_1042 [Brevundimonas abyssalis TAR-001]
MSATGLILDGVLMLLLIGAVAFGIRLERKLAALRNGQAEFAKAVSELNAAAGKAENALMALKSAGQDTDLLHDRIVKGRQLKAELEALMANASKRAEPATRPEPAPVVQERRLEPSAPPAARADPAPEQAAERASMILQALAANQTAQQSLNRARRKLDEDLFAA